MVNSLDMPLDDLIRSRSRGRGQTRGTRGRGWGRGQGGGRPVGMPRHEAALRVNTRSSPYMIAKSFNRAKDLIWRHDLFNESMTAAGLSGIETGAKLYISNLDYGVSNEDIKELFSEIGQLKRCTVHYDRNGRPSGSAEVFFARRSDAMAALKRYNNVHLDGKAMKIEIVGTNLGLPATPRVNVVGGPNGRGRRTVVMTPEFDQGASGSFTRIPRWDRGGLQRGRGRGRGLGRGGDRGRGQGRGQGRGRGRGRKQPTDKSADQLDKELDTYHAMNTS